MPLQAPNLDDRQFADIVAEVKTLIPRYTPEWTNFNESDPGITLVELFAWLTEIIIYRLNQVPDLNYIKFLQLIGIELKPAQPATAEITFTVTRPDVGTAIVPLGTQIAAAGATGTPIVFETDAALIAIGAVLAAVQSFDGTGFTVETNKNANPGQWFFPFGQNPKTGNALLLGFSSPVTFPSDEINLAVSLFEDSLAQPVLQCAGAIPPPATLTWEYWDGREWQQISVDADDTRAFSQNGHIYFRGPGSDVAMAQIGNVAGNFFWIRARLENATYENPPRVAVIRTNTVSATQAITFSDEVLGGSQGIPSQTFQVANVPVVVQSTPLRLKNSDGTTVPVQSVRLEIDEGQGFMVWQEVDDFFSSGPNDRVFTIDRNLGLITVGSGDHGRIPVANQAKPTDNVVARKYRAGGGKAGNVGPNTINQIQSFVQSIDTATNFDAASGGTDEETLANAKLRAAQALKSNDRAVTSEDFAYLSMQAPGANVRRALALPLFHPNFPKGQIPGVVTVIVVPDSVAPNPMPNQTTLQAVCAYLNTHRLLTSEVYVVGPVYRKIKIDVQLIVNPGFDRAAVKNAVVSAVTTFFDPLEGGTDGTGWPFGGEIFYSDVYRTIFTTEGVARIQDNQLLIWLDDQLQQFCRDVPINPGELLFNDPLGHNVQVSYNS